MKSGEDVIPSAARLAVWARRVSGFASRRSNGNGAAQVPIQGHVDGLYRSAQDTMGVAGWCLNLDNPHQQRTLAVRRGGRVVAAGPAQLERPDVLAAGLPTAKCGFFIHLDVQDWNGGELEVVDLETETVIGRLEFRDGNHVGMGVLPDPIVDELFVRHNFSGYREVEALLYGEAAPNLRETPAFPWVGRLDERAVGSCDPTLHAYFDHLRARCSRELQERHIDGFPAFLRWYFCEFSTRKPWRELFVPEALAKALCEPISDPLAPGCGRPRIVALAAEWLGITERDEDAILAWRLLEFVASNNLPPSVIPSGYRFDTQGLGVGAGHGLSGYDLEVHRRSETYTRKYQISNAVDALAFYFDRSIVLLCGEDRGSLELWLHLQKPSMVTFWSNPVTPGAALSRWETLLVAYARQRGLSLFPGSDFWMQASARRYFDEHVYTRHPRAKRFSLHARSDLRSVESAPRNVILGGYLNGHSGLSVNMKMFENALTSLGCPVQQCDVDLGIKGASSVGSRRFKKQAAILTANAENLPDAIWNLFARFDRLPHLTGFCLWELDRTAETQRFGLDLLDRVLVPSRFLEGVFGKVCPEKVRWIGKGIPTPHPSSFAREALGLEPDHFVFLTAFDFHSLIERKNPLATVQGFLEAFPNRSDVRLVVKANGSQMSGWQDPNSQWAAIRKLARKDHRILIIDEHWPFAQFLGLIAAADCIVSTHRSEGFGYIPAYALLLGRGVVATDYSGTQDFCTSATSMPIPTGLVPIRRGEFLFDAEGALWADPQIHDVARALRTACEDREELFARARIGQRLLQTEFSLQAFASRLEAILLEDGILEP